jgi:uncharacterized membrane protein
VSAPSAQPATEVISAIGAFIACTTLLLMVMTGLMGFRVYYRGKMQMSANALKASGQKQ